LLEHYWIKHGLVKPGLHYRESSKIIGIRIATEEIPKVKDMNEDAKTQP